MFDILSNLQNSFVKISKKIRYTDPWTLSKKENHNNKSGDVIKHLDLFANNLIINSLRDCMDIKYIASEENDDLVSINENGKYLVSIDPVDGSSNIKNNIGVGTIFSVFEYKNNDIVSGRNIVMAGYCLYSSNTTLVLGMNNMVNLYQLNNFSNFELIKENYKMPIIGDSYAINESSREIWIDDKVAKFIEKMKVHKKTQRWVGSLVADANRILYSGGTFIYPSNSKNPNGKIRLLYEAYPMAYIFNLSGGHATNGENNILDIPYPKNIHQKVPIYLFSKTEYELYGLLY